MLLLVAPNERKVRIEVGYGLEGTLTDALSKVIIANAITPRFKTGDFSGGIARGVDDIITVLSGDSAEWQPKINVRSESKAEDYRQAVPDPVHRLPDFLHLVSDPPLRRWPAARAGQPARPHHLPGRLGIVGLGRRWRRGLFRRLRRRVFRRWRFLRRRWRFGELVMRLLRASLAGLLALSLASLAALALDFPALTGRVVDQADILSPAVRTDVAAQSKELEEKSGIQLVVATVPSLQGSDIETFANQLFRAWELGQAQKNNGILLLVAPNERKVRIEVGYGLEGTLTDALASTIISGAIVPHFKRGDFSGGVEGGVHGIVAVLRTDPSQWQAQALVAAPKPRWFGEYVIMFVVFSVFLGAFALFIKDLIGRFLHPAPHGHYVKRGERSIYISPRHASGGSSSWGGSDSHDSGSSSSSQAISPVAADRQAAAEPRGAGDGIHEGTA